MVLVGISVGCLMGCFRVPQSWRETAPPKRPIKRSMIQLRFFAYGSVRELFTYNWSFCAYNGKVHLSASTDCKQKRSTASNKARTDPRTRPPKYLCSLGFSKQGSTPTPWARGLRDQIQNWALEIQKTLDF